MNSVAMFAIVAMLAASPLAYASKLTPGHEAALAHFKSGKEPTAKDAVWASSDSFKVGVVDNNTPRDGYAQSVCYTLAEYIKDTSNITVRVIDISALVRKGVWRTIGTAHCGKYQKK